jgi:hypothetical protein
VGRLKRVGSHDQGGKSERPAIRYTRPPGNAKSASTSAVSERVPASRSTDTTDTVTAAVSVSASVVHECRRHHVDAGPLVNRVARPQTGAKAKGTGQAFTA